MGQRHTRRGDDEWRAEIRRQARQDKVRIRTYRLFGNRVYAEVIRELSIEEIEALLWVDHLLGEASQQARELGHDLEETLILGERGGSRCLRCGARLYVEWRPDADGSITEGEAVEDVCSLAF
jgi:hypothetical protein